MNDENENGKQRFDESEYYLSRDLRKAADSLGLAEVRYLVDAYYTMQKQRIRAAHQARTIGSAGEPHAVVRWFFDRSEKLEKQVQAALDHFSKSNEDGRWLRSHYGVGPVIAAGLLAHLAFEIIDHESSCTHAKRLKGGCDCTRTKRIPTVGKWWRFAGLDIPENYDWSKGKRRPWNARLKTLCWKLGESFKKFHNREDCLYGRIYRERKEFEVERNERGGNAEKAAKTLAAKKFGDNETRACYEAGKLPPGRLDLRATRYAVKQFLSHYHGWGYERRFGEKPPLPYPIAHLGHTDFDAPC